MARGPLPLGPQGEFELLELLGSGAMGAVYRAREETTRREVALKVMLGDGARQRIRFVREGEIAASLDHSGITRIHSAGILGGHPYLACELVPGARTLGQAWPDASLEQRVEWVRQAAQALSYAHRRGVVHRDVKPANLLVDSDGKIKVADFGLATQEGLDRLTRSGAVVGTATYMAPEVVTGERDQVGPHTDVWSLGVVLFELLSAGELPFVADTWGQLGIQIAMAPPRELLELAPHTPPGLARIVVRALAKDVEKRYADGGALATALEDWRAGKPVPAPDATVRVSGGLIGFSIGAVLIVLGWALWRSPALPLPIPAPSRVAEQTPVDPVVSGRQAWERLQRLSVGDRLEPTLDWLDDYPEHPDRAVAESQLKSLAEPGPLWLLEHAPRGGRVVARVRGLRVFGLGEDGWLSEWDLVSGERVAHAKWLDPRDGLPYLELVGDQRLALGLGQNLALTGPGETMTHTLAGVILALSASADGAALAVSTGERGDVTLLELPSQITKRFGSGGRSGYHGLGLGARGRPLLAAQGDGGVGARQPQQLEAFDAEGTLLWVTSTVGLAEVLIVSGSEVWVGTGAGLVEVRSLETGALSRRMDPLDPEALMFEVPSADLIGAPTPTLPGRVGGIALGPDRVYAIAEGDDPHTSLLVAWSRSDGALLSCSAPRPIGALSLDSGPDGHYLAVGTARGVVEVWVARSLRGR